MSLLTPGQEKFASTFSRETKLNPRVVASWLLSEQSGEAAKSYESQGYHDWLNIANTNSGPAAGAHSSVWKNPETAGKASAEWIRGHGQVASEYGAPVEGIQDILDAAGKGPQAEINAIGSSGWATNPEYGANISSLYGQLSGENFKLAEAAKATFNPSNPTAGGATRQAAKTVAPTGVTIPAIPELGSLFGTTQARGPNAATYETLSKLHQGYEEDTRSAQESQNSLEALKTPEEAEKPVTLGGSLGEATLKPLELKPYELMPKIFSDEESISKPVQIHSGHPEPTTPKAEPTAPVATTKDQEALAKILAEANHISKAHVPHLWGGGHGGRVLPGGKVTPLDCSGAVSAALGINPEVSGELESWGAPGKGQHVTIYANAEHTFMEIDGRFWGTSDSNPGGGAGWIQPGVISPQYLEQFVARHPPGL